eukprot:56207-Alexandrium_andersonii.AAC.1
MIFLLLRQLLSQEAEQVGAPVQVLFLRPASVRHAAARFPEVGHVEDRNPCVPRDEAAGGLEHVLVHDAHPRWPQRRPTWGRHPRQPWQHFGGQCNGDPPRFWQWVLREARGRSHEVVLDRLLGALHDAPPQRPDQFHVGMPRLATRSRKALPPLRGIVIHILPERRRHQHPPRSFSAARPITFEPHAAVGGH